MELKYPTELKVTTWKKTQKTKFFMVQNTGISKCLQHLENLHNNLIDSFGEPPEDDYQFPDRFNSPLDNATKHIREYIDVFQKKIIFISKDRSYIPFFSKYCQKLLAVAGNYANDVVKYGQIKRLPAVAKKFDKSKRLENKIKSHYKEYNPAYDIRKKYIKQYQSNYNKCRKTSNDLLSHIIELKNLSRPDTSSLTQTKNSLEQYIKYIRFFWVTVNLADKSLFPSFDHMPASQSLGDSIEDHIALGQILLSYIDSLIKRWKAKSRVQPDTAIDAEDSTPEIRQLNIYLDELAVSAKKFSYNSAKFVVFLMKPQAPKQASK